MALVQVPPEGFKIVEEFRIQLGIDDCQMRAAHAAWQCGHPSKVEFITTETVDPMCGVQVPGKEEFYGVLTGNGIRLLDWTAKNKADMFCIAAPGGKPFVVVDYNYHALKGKAFVLEKITQYEEFFKKGLPPKARFRSGQMLEIYFDEHIKRDVLRMVLEYNGYSIFCLPCANPSNSLTPEISSIARFGGLLVYYSSGWYKEVAEEVDVIKAGTPIMVKLRT